MIIAASSFTKFVKLSSVYVAPIKMKRLQMLMNLPCDLTENFIQQAMFTRMSMVNLY